VSDDRVVAGRLPFPGSSDIQTIDLIRHTEPEAMARFNYEVPAELERIIRKCLQKLKIAFNPPFKP
jgi:hypothetical protein